MSYKNVYNILDFGAVAGDIRNNIPSGNVIAINNAINQAYTDGGGTVYVPVGKFYIDGTIKVKNKVHIEGEGCTTFGVNGYYIGNDFIDNPSDPADPYKTHFDDNLVSIIKTIDPEKSNDFNVFEFEGPNRWPIAQAEDFQNSGIKNLIIDGNKDNCGCVQDGIHIADCTQANQPRGHLRFYNIIIYEVNGTGFYGGINQHELYLDEVIAFRCGNNGVFFGGQDIKANRVQSAENANAGLVIKNGGAARLYDFDAWGNNIGILINDCFSVFFFGLQSNLNKQYGVKICPSTDLNAFSPNRINFYNGVFSDNGFEGTQVLPGADVCVTSNSPNMGPCFITVNNSTFKGSPGNSYCYAIIDSSYIPRKNVFNNCNFYKEEYALGIINNNAIYKFSNCYYYGVDGITDEFSLSIKFVTSNYTASVSDSFIVVGYTGSTNVVISFPNQGSFQLGKIYYVTKKESNNGTVNLAAVTGGAITGDLVLSQQSDTAMIVNFGNTWHSIKIR